MASRDAILPFMPQRWIIYGAALALAWVAIRGSERSEGRAAAPPTAAPRDIADASNQSSTPELHLERLAQRAQRRAEAELFNALAAEEVRRDAPARLPPPLPLAPPLPFVYMGKLIEAGGVTVFLTDGDRNLVVRSGDTIGGAYRVDAIGDRTMTLTYLALDIRQELGVGAAPLQPQSLVGTSLLSEALPAAVLSSSVPLPGETRLLFAAPSRVAAGNELVVSIGLPPGGAARNARVELAYDPNVLAVVGAPTGWPGRVSLALVWAAGPLAQVRFRVVAQSSTNTQIGIESATATDASGARIAIAAPGAHGVAIVKALAAN